MFTGIVQAVGEIVDVSPLAGGCRLVVSCPALALDDVGLGDSIAIDGACMTVVGRSDPHLLSFDVSRESLSRTSRLDRVGAVVNLEKAMRASDRLGGHLVSGHIDGTGRILAVTPAGESWRVDVRLPSELAPFVSNKGSIALDGVSLTVNRVADCAEGCDISVNIIPHTWEVTTICRRVAGDSVNVEVDQLAKQVARIVERILGDRHE
jgi:riboflavin synthase